MVEEEDEEEEIEEVVDIMSKDAMYNAYFICHNVQVSLNLPLQAGTLPTLLPIFLN